MHHLRRLDFFLRRAALLFSTPLGFLTAGSASLPSLPSGLPSWWFTALAPPAAVRGIDLQGAQFYHYAMHSQARCCAGCLPSGLPSWWFTALAPPAAVRGIDLLRAGSCQFLVPAALLLLL